MLVLFNILSLQLCWLACLLTYSASKQQKLWVKPLPKPQAWGGFGLLLIIATFLQNQLYHWLAAVTIVLVVVMTSWISLALCVPYLPRVKPVYLAGCVFMLATGLLGGAHVG